MVAAIINIKHNLTEVKDSFIFHRQFYIQKTRSYKGMELRKLFMHSEKINKPM